MNTSLSIVIINWNSNDLLFEQLSKLTKIVSEIIVVDNHSSESIDYLKTKYPLVTFIQNKFNRGFASACNQAIIEATNEWALFLNPDVELSESNIENLLKFSESNSYDAVSIKSNDTNYSKPLPTLFSFLAEFTFLHRVIPKSIFKSKTLIGGILLIKTKVIKDIGGWDERFFLWFEDSDLTQRLIENRYKIGFSHENIKHLGGFSLKKLTKKLQKDVFFNAMDVYSKKHFNIFNQTIISIIKQRFTSKPFIPMMNGKLVSMIIPNLKKELLDNFLEINLKHFDENTELIIVTSALNNKIVWDYRSKFPTIKFILLEDNNGFASTVNIGLRASTGKFVGTCNDDVILSKNVLEKLADNLKENIGSINPVILNVDESIESAGISVELKGKAIPITNLNHADVVDATNGACVIYSREALNKVGIFDERFGSYLEDIDLSLRLKRAGFKNLVAKDVNVIHLKHQTSKNIKINKGYLDFKNWILVISNNWGFTRLLKNFPQIFFERLRNFSGMLKQIN